MPDHRLRRLRPVLLAAATLLVASCSVNRGNYPHGQESGSWTGGSVVRTALLYVLLPVAIAGVLAALAVWPSLRNRYRYRPQEGWTADPVWFAGPPDPAAAVAQAQPGDLGRGGAGGSW